MAAPTRLVSTEQALELTDALARLRTARMVHPDHDGLHPDCSVCGATWVLNLLLDRLPRCSTP
jgi:hypothetical protein